MMKLALTLLLLTGCSHQQARAPRPLHDRLLTLDTHLDTPLHFARTGWSFGDRHALATDLAQLDIPRMADGNLDGGFFAIYTAQGPLTPEGYAAAGAFALARSDLIDTTIARFPNRIAPARTAAETRRIATHHPEKGRAREILVTPGYDGVSAPFGTFAAPRTYCDPAWLSGDADPALDYGVALMDEPTVGARLGWFGLASYSDAQLVPLLVNVSGYAADRSPRTQYYNGGRIEQAVPHFLLYAFGTERGMSGSPIFALFGDKRVAVGIHTYGSDRINRARRIDDDLSDLLAGFI